MKPGVLLLHNSLLALIFFISLFDILESKVTCDLRHLRYLYMVSCSIRKRSLHPAFNETFFANMPLDYFQAAKYYKEQKQYNPMLDDDKDLYEIFNNSEEYSESEELRVLLDHMENEQLHNNRISRNTFDNHQTPPLLLRILEQKARKSDGGNWLEEHEIPGFPREWDVYELKEPGELKFNGRRNLDKLIQKCCGHLPTRVCSASDIQESCKK